MSKSSKDLILDCTAQLLVNKGYNAFSFADISEEVGLAKPSIHHHFPSKEDLVLEVLIRYRGQIRGGLEDLSSKHGKPIDRLKGYVSFWQRCIESGEWPFCICVLLAAELPSLPKAIQNQIALHFEELGDWIISVIEDGKKTGTIHPRGSAKTEADVFRAQIHGAMISARALNDSHLFVAISKHLISGLAGAGK